MKLSYALVPIATLCSVLAHGQAPPGATPVSFTEEGLANAARVGIKSPDGDAAKSVEQALAFFKRNPKVAKSAMAEVDKKENAGAKSEGIKLFMEMYQGKGGLDLYQAKLKAVSYAYEHPELLKLAQDILFRVKKDNPTIADDYFMTWEMIAKSDPGLISELKEHVIKFSETNEKEYKQIVEMVIKTALIDPGFSANVFNHILRVDREACSGAAGECDCGGEGDGGQKGGEYSAPASTTSESPEPTEILDDAAAEESPEEEEEAPEGEVQDDEEAEGEGEAGEADEAPEVDEDPAEGEGSLEGETEEEEAPAGEGEGEVEAEGEEEAETEPAQEEAVPAVAGEGSYARPAEPKPLGYSRPAEPKPLGYARPE